ncbi:hypothetical protein SAMN02787073_3189 [Chryseobacterium vrystaatense]|uniref:Uncharacterized protein n=1 Tax=Chryseobacterium vrystaatense TaxID=307480 RepID=A0A1M5F9W7_9FLAO|nr:hypothetical protein SAMN02787073_3189 [Chryseobacterium vrystaatense]
MPVKTTKASFKFINKIGVILNSTSFSATKELLIFANINRNKNWWKKSTSFLKVNKELGRILLN